MMATVQNHCMSRFQGYYKRRTARYLSENWNKSAAGLRSSLKLCALFERFKEAPVVSNTISKKDLTLAGAEQSRIKFF